MNFDQKVLLISEDELTTKQIMAYMDKYTNIINISPDEVKVEIDRISPDIILLVQPSDGTGLDLVQYIHNENPESIIIFLSDKQDFILLRDITRAGAIDYFIIPDEFQIFANKLETIIQVASSNSAKAQAAVTGPNFKRGKGNIISFYSGKGGSGCTLMASSFAQTLKLESTAQVLLIDLNLQYGGIETYLSLESSRSMADLLPVMNELSENHIRNITEREKHSKLEILLSPCDAEQAEKITEEFVTKLIRACRRAYDFVILDLPSCLNENTYTAIEESDKIYYVMNLDTPSIRIYKRVEEIFNRLRIDTQGRLEIIINKSGRDNEIKVNDFKKMVSAPVNIDIRRDIKGIQAAINQGLPIRKEINEKKLIPAAKDIKKWVLTFLK